MLKTTLEQGGAMRTNSVRLAVAGLGVILLAACATQAQRQAQAIQTNTKTVGAQLQACIEAIYNSPDYDPLRPRLPIKAEQATLQQLTDASKATDAEISAIFAEHPRAQECRQSFLQGLSTTTPTFVPILASGYNRTEEFLIDLIQRKISWGEYVRHVKDASLDMQKELMAEGQRIDAGLQQSHQAELARRQAAADALARYAQTQALINSMNNAAHRPVMTNCITVGNTVNCLSQ